MESSRIRTGGAPVPLRREPVGTGRYLVSSSFPAGSGQWDTVTEVMDVVGVYREGSRWMLECCRGGDTVDCVVVLPDHVAFQELSS